MYIPPDGPPVPKKPRFKVKDPKLQEILNKLDEDGKIELASKKDSDGNYPMHLVAKELVNNADPDIIRQLPKMVQLILDCAKKKDQMNEFVDPGHNHPLHIAMTAKHSLADMTTIADVFGKNGSDNNVVNVENMTPLMIYLKEHEESNLELG